MRGRAGGPQVSRAIVDKPASKAFAGSFSSAFIFPTSPHTEWSSPPPGMEGQQVPSLGCKRHLRPQESRTLTLH